MGRPRKNPIVEPPLIVNKTCEQCGCFVFEVGMNGRCTRFPPVSHRESWQYPQIGCDNLPCGEFR